MSYTRVLLLHILKPLCLTSKFEIIWGIVGNSWLYAVCLSISIAYVSCRLTAASKCSSNSSHFMTCREIVYKYNVGSAFHYLRSFLIIFSFSNFLTCSAPKLQAGPLEPEGAERSAPKASPSLMKIGLGPAQINTAVIYNSCWLLADQIFQKH